MKRKMAGRAKRTFRKENRPRIPEEVWRKPRNRLSTPRKQGAWAGPELAAANIAS